MHKPDSNEARKAAPRVTRRRVICAGAAVLAAGAASAGLLHFPYLSSKRSRRRRSLVLIVADAMRGECIGKVINGRELTPNLNRLAAKSVCFTQALSSSSFTKTSVASIFTGMYAPGHLVYSSLYTVPDCETLPRFLGKHRCKAVAFVTNPFLAPEKYEPPARKRARFGFAADFSFYKHLRVSRAAGDPPQDLQNFAQFAYGEVLNRHAITFVRNYLPMLLGDDGHLFLYLHYMDSHQPWLKTRPTEFTGAFHSPASANGRSPQEIWQLDKDTVDRILFTAAPSGEASADPAADEHYRSILKSVCYEAAAYTDARIGELLHPLQSAIPALDVVVTADHGDELWEHGSLGHAKNLYNTALHVPLICSIQGFAPHQVASRVTNAAILPTLAELRGETISHTTVPSFAAELAADPRPSPPILANLVGQRKIIAPNGLECLSRPREDGWMYFDISKDPAEAAPAPLADGQKTAVNAALEKETYHSRRLSEEAGIQETPSTYDWQGRFALLLNDATMQAARAEETEAERSASLYPPAAAKGEGSTGLSEEKERQLRALGYLQ